MAVQSGQGAALTLAGISTFLPSYTAIGGPGWSRESLDTTGLANTGSRSSIGGDLYTISPVSCSFYLAPELLDTGEANCIEDLLYSSGSPLADNTITVTLANADESTFAATGHVTELQIEDFTTDQLIAGSLTFQWNTTPTITA